MMVSEDPQFLPLALALAQVLYPAFYLLPGPDHGSLENPLNTIHQLAHSPPCLALAVTLLHSA